VLGERYRIDALLDEGAMGRVYRAEHIAMRKRVAIKILRRELTLVPEVLARFEREAMAAANITHQHIASATDFGRLEDGSVYLVLEYVVGRTLRSELKRGPFSVHRALLIAEQMAEALAAAHELEIVHRDLKPENVMLVERSDQTDYIKVLDFGVAKVPMEIGEPQSVRKESGSLITKAGMVFGTPDYMAPEQALGQAVDGRADLYSLGVILFELLTGVRPFKSDHELGVLGQQLSKGVPAMALRAPGIRVPTSVESFVRKLMVNEASGRPQSAAQVAAQLAELRQRVPDSLPPQENAPTARPPAPGDPLGTPRPLDRSEDEHSEAESSGSVGASLKRVAGAAVSAFPQMQNSVVGPLRRSLSRVWSGVRAAHTGLPEPLCLMPLWVLVAVPATFVAGAFALVLALSAERVEVRGTALASDPLPNSSALTVLPSSAVTPVSEVAPTQASPAERSAALKQGVVALQTLVKRYPKDAALQVMLASASLRAWKHEAALSAVSAALALDEGLRADGAVREVVNATVRVPATEQGTFVLLKGAMGAPGADLVYELAVDPRVNAGLRGEARAWLKTRAFETASSPQASVAAALVLAPNCDIRRALTKRAGNVGDARSLKVLIQFSQGRGCAPNEAEPCNACLKGDVELSTAIANIRRRRPAK
jgi:serine/threonine-protein kinase